MKNMDLLNDLDKISGSEIVPKGMQATSVIEVTYEVSNRFDDFCREIKQFYTIDGRYIGKFDPLDQFESIVND